LTCTRLLASTFEVNEKTPINLFNSLNEEFNFDYDPCPLNPNYDIDGLKVDWGRRVFVNPPYGRAIRFWLEKALEEIEKGHSELIVFLLPAYTDVKWFHEVVLLKASEYRFLKGRLKFGVHNNSAPFASMIVIFKGKEVKL
jgi:hypothetical protein